MGLKESRDEIEILVDIEEPVGAEIRMVGEPQVDGAEHNRG